MSDELIIKITSGKIQGYENRSVKKFKGIPYAAPPVGDLRWKPPQPVESWEGIRECTQMSDISPQVEPPGMVSGFTISEDCLYLNVLTPARQPDEKLPVLVWMHGGGYSMGCGNDKVWNNYRLPLHGAVVVTLNHRLGVIGLLAHPALSKESPDGVSGNYLFLDLIASLEWIQKNIAAFGGDPDNVTIFGESGGGAKVSVMMSSPQAKGLFHRAICESGTALAILGSKPLSDIENNGVQLFEKLGIDSSEPLDQVRSLPFSKILEANQALEPPRVPGSTPVFIWDASVDGWLLPDSPENIFKSGKCNAVPLIVVANLGELTGPGPLIMPQIIPAYVDMLKAVISQGENGYACIFDQVPSVWRKDGFVSIHSIELTYVFGDWDNSTGWWKGIAALAGQAGVKTTGNFLDETDKYVSETMMEIWANFARDGKPSAESITEWSEYAEESDRYMNVCDTFEIKTGFSKVAQ